MSSPSSLYPVGTHVENEEGQRGYVLESPASTHEPYLVEFSGGSVKPLSHDRLRPVRRSRSEFVRAHRPGEEWYRELVAYECVIGSRAYGTAGPESDWDRRGFFVPPTEQITGLELIRPPGQIQGDRDPDTDRPLPGEDWEFWRLGKYLRELRKANPNYLETLWTPVVWQTSPAAERLRGIRDAFLSTRVVDTYGGYARGQLHQIRREAERADDPTGYSPKEAGHLVRLLRVGHHLLQEGEVWVQLPDALADRIQSLHESPPPIQEVESWAQQFLDGPFREAAEKTNLPEHPDYDRLQGFLSWVRRQAREHSPEEPAAALTARTVPGSREAPRAER